MRQRPVIARGDVAKTLNQRFEQERSGEILVVLTKPHDRSRLRGYPRKNRVSVRNKQRATQSIAFTTALLAVSQ